MGIIILIILFYISILTIKAGKEMQKEDEKLEKERKEFKAAADIVINKYRENISKTKSDFPTLRLCDFSKTNLTYGCIKDNKLFKISFITENNLNLMLETNKEKLLKDSSYSDNCIAKTKPTVETISLDDILYYKELGERTYTTEVSGGKVSGGGSSLGGALVGAAIAGPTGAIIGSRKEVTSSGVSSTTVEHDNRVCQIMTKKGDLRWQLGFYDLLNSSIPGKEYSIVILNNKNNQIIGSNNKNNIELLREYKRLLDEGIISEEEFNKKKEELL